MVIKFNSTRYLQTIKSNSELDDVSKIFNHANKKLKFGYGDVNYKKFKENHSPVDWKGRKVIAIPAALLAVVKAVCHLALAVLFGGLDILFNADPEFFKVHCLKVIRDGQECFGWIITLFHDSYGQFHVEEADFQKTCYDCTLVRSSTPRSDRTSPPESSFAKPSYVPPKPAASRAVPSTYANFATEFERIEKSWKLDQKDNDYIQLANNCYKVGDRDNAIKAINKIVSDTVRKDNFILLVANDYYNEGNLDKAQKLVEKITFDTKSKEKVIYNVANVYIERNEPEKSETALKKIFTDNSDPIYEKLVHSFLFCEKFEDAFRVATSHNSSEKVLVAIAEAYVNKGDRKKALKVLAKIFSACEEKSDLLVTIAHSCFIENDTANLHEALVTLVTSFIETKLRQTNQYLDYLNLKSRHYNSVEEFISSIAVIGLDEYKQHFVSGNRWAIKQGMRSIANTAITRLFALMEHPSP